MYVYVRISPWRMMGNVMPSAFAALVMCAAGWAVLGPGYGGSFLRAVAALCVCVVAYFAALAPFREERGIVLSFRKQLFRKR